MTKGEVQRLGKMSRRPTVNTIKPSSSKLQGLMPMQPPLGSIQCNNLFTATDGEIGSGLRAVASNKENDIDYNTGRRDIIFNRKRNVLVPPIVGATNYRSVNVVQGAEDDASLINRRASHVN